jgi:ATP-dependent Lon protease
MVDQKIHIANNYLLPAILKDIGLKNNDILFTLDTVTNIINNYTREGGVRKLKSLLYTIVRELNLANMTKAKINGNKIIFPYNVTAEELSVFLKHKIEIEPEKIHNVPMSGFINGLYAGSNGVGGVLPIQTLWIPTTNPLTLKATGHLKKVIKESTEVACTLAWNTISSELRDSYSAAWKIKPMGFHIHCPDGSVPKDGPSAGAALTLAIYSMLTGRKIRNDLAMTGEITLEGKVTAIGGLDEKLEGAKRAGVRLVLFPGENIKHLDKIKLRNPNLIDENFQVISVDTIEQVIQHALL